MRFTLLIAGFSSLASSGLVLAHPSSSLEAANQPCCCCDISKNVISCNRSVPKDDCFCAEVVCPPNAPTVYHGAKATAPVTSSSVAMAAPAPSASPKLVPRGHACCCCDPSTEKILCHARAQLGQCYCVEAVCPANAEVVYVQSSPED